MLGRSRTVTYLSFVSLAAAIVWLAAGMAFLAGGGVATALGAPTGGETMALGAALFAIAIVAFGVAYGFWRSLSWARTAALVVFALSVVLNVFAVIIGASIMSAILPVALAVVALWYLMQPTVRAELQPST
jgi:uncharacterized membrane protein (DUF2068 family)